MNPKELLSPDNIQLLLQLDKSPEYQNYFKWFLAITEVHRPTNDCKLIADKVGEWLKKLNVNYERDEYFNIVVRLPPNNFPSDAPIVSIQTHLDMVWVGHQVNGKIKVEYIKNFKGPNGNIDILQAPESTLGADDGFGLALALDIIENREKFPHGPMEIIMTSDEELAMTGVKHLPKKSDDNINKGPIFPLKFKYLINCDCLKGDKIYLGCAGCATFNIDLFPENIVKLSDLKNKVEVNLKFDGFQGGHSGGTIHYGRANPIKWVIHILHALRKNKINYQLTLLEGGQKMNAIPTWCHCSFILNSETDSKKIIETEIKRLKEDFSNIEKNITYTLDYKEISESKFSLSESDSFQIINFLSLIRHGILRMHPVFTDKVDSSLNLAIVSLNFENGKAKFYVCLSSRASTNTEYEKIENSVNSLLELCPIKNELNYVENAPPWPVKEKSELYETIKKVAKEEYNLVLEKGLSQVTIECPVFLSLGYDSDMASVCSTIPLAHCIGEYLDINESIKLRNILIKTLGRLTK